MAAADQAERGAEAALKAARARVRPEEVAGDRELQSVWQGWCRCSKPLILRVTANLRALITALTRPFN